MKTVLLRGLKKIRDIATDPEKPRCSGLRYLRKQKDLDILRSFVHYALQHVIPKSIWIGGKSEDFLIGRLFSIHDEALAVLLLMNNWMEWEEQAKGNDRERKKDKVRTIFTNQLDGSTSVQIKGWSNEGMREFNKIIRYLVTVRNEEDHKEIEQRLMNEYNEVEGKKERKKRKREIDDEDVLADIIQPLDGYGGLNFVQI
jgi:hypothetical protein